jgi:hypothetical protein
MSISGFIHLIVYVWLSMCGWISSCLYIWLLKFGFLSGCLRFGCPCPSDCQFLAVSILLSINDRQCLAFLIWLSVFPSISNCNCLAVYSSLVGYVSLSISGCLSLAVPFCCTCLLSLSCHCQLYLAVCFWSPIWLSLSGCLVVLV